MNLINATYTIVIGTENWTERYYRDKDAGEGERARPKVSRHRKTSPESPSPGTRGG